MPNLKHLELSLHWNNIEEKFHYLGKYWKLLTNLKYLKLDLSSNSLGEN